MSSCLSVNSMPISFSASCIMSLVIRIGAGDGRGDGVGVAVCASAFSGELETASPAAPAAGRSLTKVRRSNALVSLGLLCPGFFITVLKMISVGSIYHLSRRDEMFMDHGQEKFR